MSNDTDNSPSDHSHLAAIKDEMTPFLYPVIVEYSLIGAGKPWFVKNMPSTIVRFDFILKTKKFVDVNL